MNSDEESCSSCEILIDIGGAEDAEEDSDDEIAKTISIRSLNVETQPALYKTTAEVKSSVPPLCPPSLPASPAPPAPLPPMNPDATEPPIFTPKIKAFIVDTGKFACSAESCISDLHSDAVIVGTYQLDEAVQRRDGNIQLYELDLSDTAEVPELVSAGNGSSNEQGRESLIMSAPKLRFEQEMPHGGVLDCKWNPDDINATSPILACACAAGALSLVRLDPNWRDSSETSLETHENQVMPLSIIKSSEHPSGYLFLSLDWNNKHFDKGDLTKTTNDRGGGRGGVKIACSESQGSLSIWDVESMAMDARWSAHELCGQPSECWCVSHDPWNNSILYSGADDAVLKIWDLRTSNIKSMDSVTCREGGNQRSDYSIEAELSTKLVNKHDAGVTNICFSPHSPYYFATGSYDGFVRIWDKRRLNSNGFQSSCQPLSSVNVEGGVWRLKWNKALNQIAVGSMHSGVHILSCHNDDTADVVNDDPLNSPSSSHTLYDTPPRPRIKLRYCKHQSMAYGVDWCCNSRGIVSCSFYDHAAHFWVIPKIL